MKASSLYFLKFRDFLSFLSQFFLVPFLDWAVPNVVYITTYLLPTCLVRKRKKEVIYFHKPVKTKNKQEIGKRESNLTQHFVYYILLYSFVVGLCHFYQVRVLWISVKARKKISFYHQIILHYYFSIEYKFYICIWYFYFNIIMTMTWHDRQAADVN